MNSQPSTRDQIERAMSLLKRSPAFWRRALVVLVLGVIASVPYVFTRPRSYRSETVIMYQEAMRSADLTGGESSSESARRVGARLREVLLSRASLEPIIVDLGLFTKPGGKLGRGELIEAVDDMRRQITFRAREGDTFEISYVGATPAEAQEVTRRLGDCIVQEAASRRSENAKTLKEFLDAESERNKADLRQKEAALAQFVALNPVLAARLQGAPTAPQPGTNAPATPTSSDPVLASLESRAARIERQLRARADNTPAPAPAPRPTFVPPPDGPELVAARRDLADKLARYTDKHPDVAAARARLRVAEAQQAAINQAAADAFAAQQARVAAVETDPPPPKNASDEAALRKELENLQGMIANRRAVLRGATAGDAGGGLATAPAVSSDPEVALEVEFRRLTREVNEGRERQHQLDEKLFKASITASSVMNDRNIQVSVLDPAYLPHAPISRSRTTLLAGLLALCFALAIGTAIGSAVIDDRIYDRVDVERIDVLPVLGVIPRAALPPAKDRPS